MAEMIRVKALRDHRNGYAPDGKADKDAEFSVPADRLPAMVRQKLVAEIEDEAEAEASAETEVGAGDEDDGQG